VLRILARRSRNAGLSVFPIGRWLETHNGLFESRHGTGAVDLSCTPCCHHRFKIIVHALRNVLDLLYRTFTECACKERRIDSSPLARSYFHVGEQLQQFHLIAKASIFFRKQHDSLLCPKLSCGRRISSRSLVQEPSSLNNAGRSHPIMRLISKQLYKGSQMNLE
jgi:hypothetical protein